MLDFSSLQSSTKTGKQIFELSEGDKVIGLKEINGDNVIVLSTSFKMLIFSVKELPLLKKVKAFDCNVISKKLFWMSCFFHKMRKVIQLSKKYFQKMKKLVSGWVREGR